MTGTEHITLVLGGARSGKSRFAEQRAAHSGAKVIYVATAQAGDEEMRARIALHQKRRDPAWQTLCVPLELADAVRAHGAPETLLLIDCLTIWIANLMAAGRDIAAETQALAAALEASPAHAVLVANEVGLGIVPDNAMARAFRDHAGLANQRMAECADAVFFLAAGLPLRLKPQEAS